MTDAQGKTDAQGRTAGQGKTDAHGMYGMPEEIDVRADGPLRIITLNRPDALNAVNDPLHTGLARLWPRLGEDRDARAAVLTGAGKAFSAGGDFTYLDELRRDADLRARTIAHGRDLVLGMARCRVPVIAAVNGPAVGLGCSLVALSDIVYLADSAYLADPHVQVGLVAADGGPLTWPLHTSLLLAKEYALTGARIPAERAVAMGLANHVVADPLAEATACAKRIAGLPRQAVESTKRVLNMHLERAVLATLDYATTAEEQSFRTEDFRATIARLTGGDT
ncbi:enoyl-CoA hydratase/isomerase family protein [Streptomyces sp. MMG1533]|uniref:enoyl-CoA hydratase/isomerase family protein n=1 Tax=Streptomyces sp. MMG1533 TaxID=1415546 RepID=UPI000AB149E5|nr:enoyl-CoA hydratase/isomerase family protein [Streptomyces sp. MMG1533]